MKKNMEESAKLLKRFVVTWSAVKFTCEDNHYKCDVDKNIHYNRCRNTHIYNDQKILFDNAI